MKTIITLSIDQNVASKLDRVAKNRSKFIENLLRHELQLDDIVDVDVVEDELVDFENNSLDKNKVFIKNLESTKAREILAWLVDYSKKYDMKPERLDLMVEANAKRLGVPVGLLRSKLNNGL